VTGKRTDRKYREALADARRIVVKVGTRVLVRETGRPDARRMRSLSRQMAALRKSGREVLLVTSGAVGAGMEALGMSARPTRLPDLQMAAAVGQARLMARYDALFSALGVRVGQVLLTHADFLHGLRFNNARRTLENLLRHGVIPIVNENDVVADEEIRADLSLGDNDYLASLIARMVRADLLVILSTVNGLLADGSGARTRVPILESVDRRAFELVRTGPGALSRGGMATKLRAARDVARAGAATVIADGRMPRVLQRVLDGDDVGTLVPAAGL
jgi:glutamate 5-kinase